MTCMRHNYAALNISGPERDRYRVICMGPTWLAARHVRAGKLITPAAGDTRTAVAIGPSWWPGLPAACTPLFLLYRPLASLWLPLIALMYSITTSVQLHFTNAAVPPHLLPPPGQPGGLSELDGSRGWHALVKPQSAVKPSSSRPRGRSFGRP